MDDRIINERGVIRVTARQLSMLWLDITDRCGVSDLIDIQQPESFNGELDWSVFERSDCN